MIFIYMEKSQELANQIEKTINSPIVEKTRKGTNDIKDTISNTNKLLDKNQISSEEDRIENKLIKKRVPVL